MSVFVLFTHAKPGAFTVTIEMKVDIRDAAAWGKLEQALTRLAEGRRGGSDSGSPAHRPLHAASAPVLHGPGGGSGGAEEEEEEDLEDLEDLEPLSPDSSASAMAALAVAAGGGAEAGAAVLEAHEGGGGKKRGLMGGIRQKAARKLRQLAESTATKISRWVAGAAKQGGWGSGEEGQCGRRQALRCHFVAPRILTPTLHSYPLPACAASRCACP